MTATRLIFTATHAYWESNPGKPWPARSREWRLFRVLLVRDEVHWLDGFVIFPSWQEVASGSQPLGDYREQFVQLTSRLSHKLRARGLADTAVLPTSKGRDWYRLTFSEQPPDTDIQRHVGLLREAERAFLAGRDGAEWLTDALGSQWYEPVSVARALLSASLSKSSQPHVVIPSPRAREAMESERASLLRAISSIRVLPSGHLGQAQTADAQIVFRQWFDALAILQQALESGAPEQPVQRVVSDVATDRFLCLMQEFRDSEASLPQAGRRHADAQYESPASAAARSQRDRVLDQLIACDITKRAIDAVNGLTSERLSLPDVRRHAPMALLRLIQSHTHPQPETVLPYLCNFLRQEVRGELFTDTVLDLGVSEAEDRDDAEQMLDEILASLSEDDSYRELLEQMASRATRPSPNHDIVATTIEYTAGGVEAIRSEIVPTPQIDSATAADASLKSLLLTEASAAFVCHLQSLTADQYRPVDFESDEDDVGSLASMPVGRLGPRSGRSTHRSRFQLDGLLRPTSSHLIHGPPGYGKSSFLRYLQGRINTETENRAVCLQGQELAALRTFYWPEVAELLARRLSPRGDSPQVREALNQAYEAQRLVFLVDDLDALAASGSSANHRLRELLTMTGVASVIATQTQPGPVADALRHFRVLHMRPFSPDTCREFFGPHLAAVSRLAQWEPSILRSPLLAYLSRDLAIHNPGVAATSLMDLYDQFVGHVLKRCELFGSASSCDNLTAPVIRSLGELSYAAIDRNPPIRGSVPVSLVGADAELQTRLKELACRGIPELLLPSPGHNGEECVFTHRSFQEYFASMWAREHAACLESILIQCWNPKWHRVLELLAGVPELAVVPSLAAKQQADDPLRTHIHISCVSASGAAIHPKTEDHLITQLLSPPGADSARIGNDTVQTTQADGSSPLLSDDWPGWSHAIDSLARIGGQRSRDMAWCALVNRLRSDGLFMDRWVRDALVRLCTPDRTRSIVAELRRSEEASACSADACWILEVWADQLDGALVLETTDVLFDRVCSGDEETSFLGRRALAQLARRWSPAVARSTWNRSLKVGRRGIGVRVALAKAIPEMLAEEEMRNLVIEAIRWHEGKKWFSNHAEVWQLLIANKALVPKGLMEDAAWRRLPDDECCDDVGCDGLWADAYGAIVLAVAPEWPRRWGAWLRSRSAKRRKQGLLRLLQVAPHLDAETVELVLGQANDRAHWVEVLTIAVQAGAGWRGELGAIARAGINDGDEQLQSAVLSRVRWLRSHLGDAERAICVERLGGERDSRWLDACVMVFSDLSTVQRQVVLARVLEDPAVGYIETSWRDMRGDCGVELSRDEVTSIEVAIEGCLNDTERDRQSEDGARLSVCLALLEDNRLAPRVEAAVCDWLRDGRGEFAEWVYESMTARRARWGFAGDQ